MIDFNAEAFLSKFELDMAKPWKFMATVKMYS